jgi:hypothetical protein
VLEGNSAESSNSLWARLFSGIKSGEPCRNEVNLFPEVRFPSGTRDSGGCAAVKKLLVILLIGGLLSLTTGCPSAPTVPTPPEKDKDKGKDKDKDKDKDKKEK